MIFLAPFAFWGLLALSVPLLLHLRRRRVGRTIQVGSLQHLETLPTAERRGPRLREPLRLLLRLAILGLVVMVLAGPFLQDGREVDRPMVVEDSSSSPWERIAQLDDSLPPGIPLAVVATTSSDLFHGPRPLVRRRVEWTDSGSAPRRPRPTPTASAPSTPAERRALGAAVTATVEVLGAPGDTAGWESRLPPWWRDSLDVAAFPEGVARALIPERALPVPTRLTVRQVTPRTLPASEGAARALDLHWWIWGAAALLLLVERLWARRTEWGR